MDEYSSQVENCGHTQEAVPNIAPHLAEQNNPFVAGPCW